MNKKLLALLFLVVIAFAQPHPTGFIDDDEDNQDIVPVWKINVVLRDNGNICYDYSEGCNYACSEECFNYNGPNSDPHLSNYKYCCPRHL